MRRHQRYLEEDDDGRVNVGESCGNGSMLASSIMTVVQMPAESQYQDSQQQSGYEHAPAEFNN